MRIVQKVKALRDLSPLMVAKWVVEAQEFRVTFTTDAIARKYPEYHRYQDCIEKAEALAYYTPDYEDAMGTAKAMLAAWTAQEPA